MNKFRSAALVLGVLLLSLSLTSLLLSEGPAADRKPGRPAALKLLSDGNFKEAYVQFRLLALDPSDDPLHVAGDLNQAIQCLTNLGRTDEIDDFRDAVIKAQGKNWRLLQAAAESLVNGDHSGFIIAGKFARGQRRGGDRAVNAGERDRVRGLQLMVEAQGLVRQAAKNTDAGNFFLSFADMWLANRGYSDAWRLQALTDLKVLPDYEEGWADYQNDGSGAPVGADGQPIYQARPKSFEAAQSDGERWRWCLTEASEVAPSMLNEVRSRFADFCYQQFGAQTLVDYGAYFGRLDDDNEGAKKNESGPYALATLKDTEAIARLATGIKRFDLPDAFNFIKLYQQIIDDPQTGHAEAAADQLAQIFENRRQYAKAADYWRKAIRQFGPGQNHARQDQLNQIVQNWGRFESASTEPAGQGATVEYRFRNGAKVHFEADEIKIQPLLEDVKGYLQGNPPQLDWQKMNIADIGYRLVAENQSKYRGAKAAAWDLPLEPRPNHYDRRVTVATPLQKPGAYLLTATMQDGNVSHLVLWIADTAIVKKPVKEGSYYFVGDAVTGKPIEKANLEFFGWRQLSIGANRFKVDTKSFAEFTDADGQLIQKEADNSQFQWLIMARTQGGRFAYLGFSGVWTGNAYDAEYAATKTFGITDRPVYRPSQKVHFKFWIRTAKYDQDDKSAFANQSFTVEIHNPKGEKLLSKNYLADAFGGIEGDYDLPQDATLGVYQATIVNQGSRSFRVEEYKKPEYEVTIAAPTEPIMLGDKFRATIHAKYYFGEPVVKAKVKYTVTRTSVRKQWYPLGDWDWLYGPGYWWFESEHSWYPGWRDWGCGRPAPFWFGFGEQPPEIVAQSEAAIGPDGTLPVEIDTALAKEVHGDQDHEYAITAEVVDESRRTIVGTGKVLVARQPFKVYAWVDRGFYHVGDTIRANFTAQTLAQKPVTGAGKLSILKITYDKSRKPIETPVKQLDLDPDEQGHAALQFTATAAGQYRLAYSVTDSKKRTIEGGYLFTIIGEKGPPPDLRFNPLELVPDKREYRPGESVNLQINTDRAGGTVLLFVRPANGVYLKPKVLRLKGKTAVEELAVLQKDMPNFFVEAVTLSGAKFYSEVREIVVPPEKRVLKVDVLPSADSFKPSQPAKIKIKLTDFFGKPFVGSTVVTMYDKALEYISGGSNVGDIKDCFWNWRRQHQPMSETTLDRVSGNLDLPNKPGMQNLGIFGADVVPEAGEAEDAISADPLKDSAPLGGLGGGGFGGGLGGMAKAPAPQAAPGMGGKSDAAAPAAPLVIPTIRTKFADTAFWAGALTTDQDGLAEVALSMPENLTAWKVRVWAMGHGTKVGQGEAEMTTKKNLIIRLQAPRYFVEQDEVVLSANIHNYLKKAKKVTAQLIVNEALVPLEAGKQERGLITLERTLELAPGDEQRVDWRVAVAKEGEAIVRMAALTDEDSDATEQRFPVYVHGMRKTESFSGVMRPDKAQAQLSFSVPAQRRVNDSRLEIRYSPTLAGALVDALPYLADYPYGCTEQTLNRFVPTVITQKILINLGLDLKAIREKRTNLNSQEIGEDPPRAAQWKRFDRNPVFDQEEVKHMVQAGVQRLTEMQLADGGWGWFSGWGEHSSAHTTCVVMHGLQTAQHNDVALVPAMLERGIQWLKNYQDQQVQLLKNAAKNPKPANWQWKDKADNLDAYVYMVLVDEGIKNQEMLEFLYRDRLALAVYAKALFGLALEKQGEKEKLAMVLQNIGQYVVQDEEDQTAYLKLPEDNYWWSWYGSEIEAEAYYLKLLAQTEPKGTTASRLVKYLLNNRQNATYWSSTRDTALCIEALADYLKASGENKPNLTISIAIDGQPQKEVQITPSDLFTFDNKLVLTGDAVTTGDHKLEFKKQGNGPLYFNAYLTNFTLEDHIAHAGLEVKINRRLYRLVKADKSTEVAGARGQVVEQKVEKYDRQPLADRATLKSGDLIEVELEIDSKNDYEYLLIEDMKAAGFEPIDVRSGYTSAGLNAYQEMRDDRVCFFVRQLARGKHSVSYRLRAEIPGRFSALPARVSAMYAPELKGNSDEIKLRIED
ncbi:MAG TPA: MG2 domain-containing protein [Pirellulales bacterium]|nr:MG2 domain-containing protein [Pirellulales bacterium]